MVIYSFLFYSRQHPYSERDVTPQTALSKSLEVVNEDSPLIGRQTLLVWGFPREKREAPRPVVDHFLGEFTRRLQFVRLRKR